MAQTFTGRKRVRKVFGHVKEGVGKEEAAKIKAALEKAGAKVELK